MMNDSSTPPPIPSEVPFGSVDQPHPPKKSWVPGCLMGCFVALVISALCCAGIGYYVYQKFPQLAGDFARQAIAASVDSSELPDEEKAAIMAEVDRVIDAYQAREISNEQLGEILQGLAESPLMGLVMVQGVEAKYVGPSGLSEAEKIEARRTIMRVVRGAIEEKIDKEEIETLTEYFTTGAGSNRQLKPQMADEELRECLAEAKRMADEAEIPDEDYELRISDEIRRIVDQALADHPAM